MRVEHWNPNVMDESFAEVATARLIEAAEVVAQAVRAKCPVGTTSRPIYKRGPYAGQAWTARDAGQLKKSIRVVTKKSKYGKEIWRQRNVRVYAGHYLAYYASIVEHTKPFMRPAFYGSIPAIKSIVGAK